MSRDADPAKTTPTKDRFRIPHLREFKAAGKKIVALTAYDYSAARSADRAGVDIVLVGDTLGMVVLGYDSTLPVTMDEMLHHVRAVRRGLKHPLLLADMPFGSYQSGADEAVRNASRLLKEGGAEAVKVEGGAWLANTVQRLTQSGIPVVCHLGLMPQSVNLIGGHKVQGREQRQAEELHRDAMALEAAGAVALVLEAIPASLAAQVTLALSIPTIGIGAGPDCDGQVQVWHDMLAVPPGKNYRHVRTYANVGDMIESAIRSYGDDVRKGQFPSKENSL